jgi:hypothetical protein
MAVLVAALTAVLVVLAILVVGLLRSHAEILRRLHDLGAGLDPEGSTDAAAAARSNTPAPFTVHENIPAPADRAAFPSVADLAGEGLDDDAVIVRVTGSPQRTLLAFLSSSCLTCRAFWEAFRPRERELPADVRLVVVAKDAAEENLDTLRELAPPPDVPLVLSSAAWVDYEVPGSPYFVLVDGAAGRVTGEGTGASWSQVRDLLAQATSDPGLGNGTRRRRPSEESEAAREARIDQELMAAGISPGDASLFPSRRRAAPGGGEPRP